MILMTDVPNKIVKMPPRNVHRPPTLPKPLSTDLSRVCSTILHSAKWKGVTMRRVDTSGARTMVGDVTARGSGHTWTISNVIKVLYDLRGKQFFKFQKVFIDLLTSNTPNADILGLENCCLIWGWPKPIRLTPGINEVGGVLRTTSKVSCIPPRKTCTEFQRVLEARSAVKFSMVKLTVTRMSSYVRWSWGCSGHRKAIRSKTTTLLSPNLSTTSSCTRGHSAIPSGYGGGTISTVIICI